MQKEKNIIVEKMKKVISLMLKCGIDKKSIKDFIIDLSKYYALTKNNIEQLEVISLLLFLI